jgi:hypothetical protein
MVEEMVADFRADLAQFREEVRATLNETNRRIVQMETRLQRWMLIAAGTVGLIGALIAAVAQLIK